MKMDASLSSVRTVMAEFIETYRSLECLWKVTDENYKNKQRRREAAQELLVILKKIDSAANLDSVTKKINSLRSAFNKEHNKVKAFRRSSIGGDEEYIPKLWYYDLFLFLDENQTDCERSYDINGIINDESMEQDMDINTYQASERSESPLRSDSNIANAKKRERYRVNKALNKISKRLDSSTIKTKPHFSAFGEHVAERLRMMSSHSAKYCQKIINDAIFYAEFDNLNHTSRIVTDDPLINTSQFSNDRAKSYST